ncbi:unnamed protein product [Spirodela intermedia]|uniref:Uncharacterized protein n=1 Tax=Spirodela intermedia TaxID=51605 RepID=A0A7I8KXT0_SPIIN|nr:unnamed protein product [Spirodela intermedia]
MEASHKQGQIGAFFPTTSTASLKARLVALGCAYVSRGISPITRLRSLATSSCGICDSSSSMRPHRSSPSRKTEYSAASAGRNQPYCVYAVCGEKKTGTQPASTASNTDRLVKESPGGCKQNSDPIITSSTRSGSWHWLEPGSHSTLRHLGEAPHCSRIAALTAAFSIPFRGPPTKANRCHLLFRARVEVGRVGDAELVVAFPRISLHGEHRHVCYGGESEETVGAEVYRAVGVVPHEVPSGAAQRQEVVAAVAPPPGGLIEEEFLELHRQAIALGEIGFPELAGGVEAPVEGNVEDLGNEGVRSPARVSLCSCMEDHLPDELMGGVPAAIGSAEFISRCAEDELAEAAVGDVRAHISVYVERAAGIKKREVEPGGQIVHIKLSNALRAPTGDGRELADFISGVGTKVKDLPLRSPTTVRIEESAYEQEPRQ